jgi:N-alpha-acetyltransferase 50
MESSPAQPQAPARYRIAFDKFYPSNIDLFKELNSKTIIVQYSPSFYLKLMGYDKYSRLAYLNDILVGGISCREEEFQGAPHVYILTIGVLEPYRRHGIASQLLEFVVNLVKQDKKIKGIYLHMQTSNEAAKNFYLKHGFEITKEMESYYMDLNPSSAYVFVKDLHKEQAQS